MTQTPMTQPDAPWLAGCGVADITGEPWRVGLMGYGMRFQRSTGIQLRQRSRAFVLVDRASGRRLVYVVADIGMFFRNVREAVLARLDPTTYDGSNVLLTATHTHAGVAGYSGYRLYNSTTNGFRPRTFHAIVDGVVGSIERAEADLAPTRLVLSRGTLTDASVNRSPQSFARNPDGDRAVFPDAIDPAMTLVRLERGGRLIGAIDWFATHGTSLTNRNTLISGDNKGYAAYRWERSEVGVDYLDDTTGPRFVAAFAQTNAGDMSPNVPDATHGPTDDEVENTRIIGDRQYAAARALAETDATEIGGGLDFRLAEINLSRLDVAAEFTSDSRPHRTGRAVLGAAFAAGTKEGPGVRWCSEGVDGNRLLAACCAAAYAVRPQLGDAQRPKAMLLPVGRLGWVADVLPVQLVRIGPLVLVALAQEVTIVAGRRLRRAVAEVLGLGVDDVLVQGYANDYAGYVTTPEEYDAQRYEGGHTMFGRWQLAAYLQEVTRLAIAMRDGTANLPTRAGAAPPQHKTPAADEPPARCLAVARQPEQSYRAGDEVLAEFRLDSGEGRLLPAYLLVERRDGDRWLRVADDGDWSTTIEWVRRGTKRAPDWVAHAVWRTPPGTSGTFRMSYVGDAATTTQEFTVGA
jgi:neutral ceramidase